MELIDAYEIIKVSPEEIASIERYLGYKHTGINVLSDLTPERYNSLNKSGWKLPETEEEIKDSIVDFVNIYSAMYKESKGRTTRLNLIRGTSKNDVPKTNSIINQMLSTSTEEGIAKTFCEYQNAALIRFAVEPGVPFLDAESYREEDRVSEEEIILAPFCSVSKNEFAGEYETYAYHNVSIKKSELPEVSDEELQVAMEEVSSGFLNNLENIKEYLRLVDKYEILTEKLNKETDLQEKSYIFEEREKILQEYEKKLESVNKFRERLQFLLKGLCRQKELEIDRAQEVVQQEEQRLQDDLRKRARDEKRKQDELKSESDRINIFSSLDTKSLKMPSQSQDLQKILDEAYQKMIETETRFKEIAEKLKIPYTKLVTSINAGERIEQIKRNIEASQSRVNQTTFSSEDSLETMGEVSSELTPVFDGITYSLEIAKSVPGLVQMHKKQSDDEIKRQLFIKAQKIMQEARVDKYLKDRDLITKKGISFFSGFTRKNDLQIERLNNINLKIQLAQITVCDEPQECSIKDILASLYACAITELGGKFTPKMQELYESLKNNFEDFDKEKITEEDIKKLAREKIIREQSRLPVLVTPKKGFFGKTKNQIELLRLENKGLEEQIAQAKSRPQTVPFESDGQDAIATFDYILKGISKHTSVYSQERTTQDLEKTVDLFA